MKIPKKSSLMVMNMSTPIFWTGKLCFSNCALVKAIFWGSETSLKIGALRPQDWSRLKPYYYNTISAIKAISNFVSLVGVFFCSFLFAVVVFMEIRGESPFLRERVLQHHPKTATTTQTDIWCNAFIAFVLSCFCLSQWKRYLDVASKAHRDEGRSRRCRHFQVS